MKDRIWREQKDYKELSFLSGTSGCGGRTLLKLPCDDDGLSADPGDSASYSVKRIKDKNDNHNNRL